VVLVEMADMADLDILAVFGNVAVLEIVDNLADNSDMDDLGRKLEVLVALGFVVGQAVLVILLKLFVS
jgi:hypothetical protein